MNKYLTGFLKEVGKAAGAAALNRVPGGSAIVSGVGAIVAARKTPEKTDDVEAYLAEAVQILTTLESLDLVDFADEPQFQAGLYSAKAAFTQMVAAVRAHRLANPTPAA
jgi:hypothetical protein